MALVPPAVLLAGRVWEGYLLSCVAVVPFALKAELPALSGLEGFSGDIGLDR